VMLVTACAGAIGTLLVQAGPQRRRHGHRRCRAARARLRSPGSSARPSPSTTSRPGVAARMSASVVWSYPERREAGDGDVVDRLAAPASRLGPRGSPSRRRFGAPPHVTPRSA
jgi:hypothetical protein